MSANLCVEAHLRELLEQGFEVFVVKDATAAAKTPDLGDGYAAAVTNFGFIANAVMTTKEWRRHGQRARGAPRSHGRVHVVKLGSPEQIVQSGGAGCRRWIRRLLLLRHRLIGSYRGCAVRPEREPEPPEPEPEPLDLVPRPLVDPPPELDPAPELDLPLE